MEDDWVRIRQPQILAEMLDRWVNSEDQSIGLCLLCGQAIKSEADLIPGTPLHNFEAQRASEARTSPPLLRRRCRRAARVNQSQRRASQNTTHASA
jgi:hypothetical protein